MNLNFSQEEIAFQNEVKEFLDKELTPELVNAAKRTSAVFTETEVAMEWQPNWLKKVGWFLLGQKSTEERTGMKHRNISSLQNVQMQERQI